MQAWKNSLGQNAYVRSWKNGATVKLQTELFDMGPRRFFVFKQKTNDPPGYY